jgi:hypothetical protein
MGKVYDVNDAKGDGETNRVGGKDAACHETHDQLRPE